jgi:glycosyltransferase involved in cell wall biosynthesis
MQVEKCPWSLETQAKDLATADIGLAPLPDNRFTSGKCGFKALQYAAAALPAVASPVGVNAEYVIDAVTGYHASNIEQWVERTAELIRSVELRKQFASAAKKHVQKFDKNVIGKKLSAIISDFVKPASVDLRDTEA